MTTFTQSSLWDFACGLYEFAEVKQQCLELQNTHGANVDIILWLCWLHATGQTVAQPALAIAVAEVGGADGQLLRDLRELRGPRLKGSGFACDQQQEIRSHLLSAELAIEKALLQRLQMLTPELPSAAQQRPLALDDYLGSLDTLDRKSAQLAAEQLLSAVRETGDGGSFSVSPEKVGRLKSDD